jgi:hypothetical protein
MQCEDVILKKMFDENKSNKIIMDNGLKVTRPEPRAILSEEIYLDNKNPFNETQVIVALKKLWLQDKRVKNYETKKDDNQITWWVLQ